MRVAFGVRDDLFINRGGDTIQILNSKLKLEENYGVCIEFVTPLKNHEYLKHCDIFHIFNIQDEKVVISLLSIKKDIKLKTVLTPIYWDFYYSILVSKYPNVPDFCLYIYKFFRPLICNMLKYSPFYKGYLSRSYSSKLKCIINSVDFLLPNSNEELMILAKDSRLSYNKLMLKSEVVPNAFKLNIKSEIEGIKLSNKPVIGIIGRIEPVKNQHRLIQALYHEDVTILIVGRANTSSPKFKKYYDSVLALAVKRGNVIFKDEISHEDIPKIMKSCDVHILPSFRESPGLSTLEALFLGVKIVTSSEFFCPVKFYKFDKYGFQCEPYFRSSIKKAVRKAFNSRHEPLDDNFKYTYSYDNVARIINNSYVSIVNQH